MPPIRNNDWDTGFPSKLVQLGLFLSRTDFHGPELSDLGEFYCSRILYLNYVESAVFKPNSVESVGRKTKNPLFENTFLQVVY